MHSLFNTLRQRGWTVRLAASQQVLLPTTVATRYATLQQEILDFLAMAELCCNADETVWLFTAEDYAQTDADRFRWNECELMSLDAATDDPSWQAEITAFWDNHFPFMLAVHSDYDYLAVRISDGSVVHGCAPEWESPTQVTSSFGQFIKQFELEAISSIPRYPFSIFLGTAGDPTTYYSGSA